VRTRCFQHCRKLLHPRHYCSRVLKVVDQSRLSVFLALRSRAEHLFTSNFPSPPSSHCNLTQLQHPSSNRTATASPQPFRSSSSQAGHSPAVVPVLLRDISSSQRLVPTCHTCASNIDSTSSFSASQTDGQIFRLPSDIEHLLTSQICEGELLTLNSRAIATVVLVLTQ
jgi:hypothetical protein